MSTPPDQLRRAPLLSDDNGPYHSWDLTHSALTDLVELLKPPSEVLPILFVPGIMGSNLRSNNGKKVAVWTVNSSAGVGSQWGTSGAAKRQEKLDPNKTEVDPNGDVPDKILTIGDKAAIIERGWGEISKAFYGDFLVWLESVLNGPIATRESMLNPLSGNGADGIVKGWRPEAGSFSKLAEDEIKAMRKFSFPVYACGYNWLQSNRDSAEKDVAKRIREIIAKHGTKYTHCDKVLLVTHSMGGLVSRACSELVGMQEQIAGIVHGAQPAVGAAVAYRRCKVGMWDEDWKTSLVMGSDGPKTVAVFANSPGALQLLPTQDYKKGWLTIKGPNGRVLKQLPEGNPYDDIYKIKDKWWGVVNSVWIDPSGKNKDPWSSYLKNLSSAQAFHQDLSGKFHPNTYVFYGDDPAHASFEGITWQAKAGQGLTDASPKLESIPDLSYSQVRYEGDNDLYVGGEKTYFHGQTSYWEAKLDKQDGTGDGTVPANSGNSPKRAAKSTSNIKQQFRMSGFDHAGAYGNDQARLATLYSIAKIAATVKVK